MKAPHPMAVQRAMAAMVAARDALVALDPVYGDDELLLASWLDSEAPAALETLMGVVRAAIENDRMAELAQARAYEIIERRDRFRRRESILRDLVQTMMQELGMKRLEMPDVDAVIAEPGDPGAEIVDPGLIPDQFRRVVTTEKIDGTGVRKALLAGEAVPGAVLNNARPTLRLRTK